MLELQHPVLIIETLKISSIYPWLFTLDLTLPDGTTKLYLVHNTEDITYLGQTYMKFPFQIELPSGRSKGQIPQWTIRVSNVTRVLEPYLEQFKGLNGTKIKMRIVNAGHLTINHAELETDLEVLQASSDAEWVTFICGGPNFLNQMFPVLRYISGSCRWLGVGGFKGAECAYTGSASTCDGTLKRCRELSNSKRYAGYPGLSSRGAKLV